MMVTYNDDLRWLLGRQERTSSSNYLFKLVSIWQSREIVRCMFVGEYGTIKRKEPWYVLVYSCSSKVVYVLLTPTAFEPAFYTSIGVIWEVLTKRKRNFNCGGFSPSLPTISAPSLYICARMYIQAQGYNATHMAHPICPSVYLHYI